MDAGIPTQVAPAELGGPQTLAGATTNAAPAGVEPRAELPPVIFFDGVCGLCNRFIDFVIARDRAGVFRFATLQGETARERLPAADLDLNTMVLWEGQGILRKSTAAARILIGLGGVWALCGTALGLVPRPLRDVGYSFVARNRYRIFGKKETCRMPTAAERARFLP
ncbi:MAG TPA: DCC1-like thiol-disulfide oxidoreductase family protein [Planctomycetaceae bacterium]|jgi:predicted DCC family thiol-disulfide oxidoreductase YuxK|nr:DCC1-like thiol-disulfide oxidoreductase family protein [Planctomycetaceae bacterium]